MRTTTDSNRVDSGKKIETSYSVVLSDLEVKSM